MVSRIEQTGDVDGKKLQQISEALGVTVETIKNFNEDTLLTTSNFFNSSFQDHSTAVANHFNPIEKIIELYERMLREKDEQIKALQRK